MIEMLEYTAGLPEDVIPAGSVLIEEGQRPATMWVLLTGVATVERDNHPFARIDSPGAVFGEMSWVLDKPATATVRANTVMHVRVITDPEAFFLDQPHAALAVLRTTASRLDGLTQYLVDVKRQFAHLDGHLGMVDRMLDTLVHHQGPQARTGSVRDPEVH